MEKNEAVELGILRRPLSQRENELDGRSFRLSTERNEIYVIATGSQGMEVRKHLRQRVELGRGLRNDKGVLFGREKKPWGHQLGGSTGELDRGNTRGRKSFRRTGEKKRMLRN